MFYTEYLKSMAGRGWHNRIPNETVCKRVFGYVEWISIGGGIQHKKLR